MVTTRLTQEKPIKKRTYGSWERGEVTMNIEQLCACADVLDCSTDALLGREIRTDFSDPREAELHRVWGQLSDRGKANVLHDARAEASLERGGAADAPVADVREAV